MQSSHTGTESSDSFKLSAADICRIIKQCHAAGVSELSISGMSFKFHPRRNEDAEKLGQASDALEQPKPETDTPRTLDSFELATQLDAEEAQLLIDDPYAFERVQIDRHIERGRQLA
jgi:hypothetical protein